MSRKLTGALYIIVGIIALVGSAFFALSLIAISSSVSVLTEQFGTDAAVGSLNMFIIFAWIWFVTVLVSSLITIMVGIRKAKYKSLRRRI